MPTVWEKIQHAISLGSNNSKSTVDDVIDAVCGGYEGNPTVVSLLAKWIQLLHHFDVTVEVSSAAPIFTTAKLKLGYRW